jgi:hypothetical protein
MKKSFSRVDNSYMQLFKHKRKLTKLNGDYKIKDLITGKKNNLKTIEIKKTYFDTTSTKLDQIISKLQKSNSFITQQFFEDSNLQLENEELRERMKVLLKRRKAKENIEKIEKEKQKCQINSAKEAIEHMLYFSKKYAVDKEFIRINNEQNNKCPPICRYTPSLSYISKHIPVVYFGYHNKNNSDNIDDGNIRTKTLKNFKKFKSLNINDTNNTLEEGKKNNNSQESINNSIEETANKNKNKINNVDNYTKKRNKIKIIKKIMLNKQKEPNLLNKIMKKIDKKQSKNKNNSKLKTISNDVTVHKTIKKNIIPSHSIIKYNISVPLFSKMTSRAKNGFTKIKNKNMADYTPNYDAIYPSNYKHDINTNENFKKKKYRLRKILGSYNIGEEYILLPVLNK